MNRTLLAVVFAISLGVVLLLGWFSPKDVQPLLASSAPSFTQDIALPLPQVHSLPPSLVQWQDSENQGNYFSEIQPTSVGYLIWSQFPVSIYIEPPDSMEQGDSSEWQRQRSHEWFTAVVAAVTEWQTYLPLEQIDQAEAADIVIWRRTPPLRRQNQEFRARAAETRYEIFVNHEATPPILAHQFTILLSPNQTLSYTQATARHELGHALGIWGHSPVETDALYYAQVRNPPSISVRDVNTLKRVYEQPTRLGWPLPFEQQD